MLDYALTAFVTLIVVVDPVGIVPAFLSATHGLPDSARNGVGLCAAAFAFAGRVANVLGITGNVVLSRLLGVVLAALAV